VQSCTAVLETRVELLPGFKFTGKMVKKMKFTGKIGKTVKNGKNENSGCPLI
jgi:hypothetical protein